METYRAPTSGPDDRYRPIYHFTPPEQWMNDPNGLVYLDGEYHLFYQHYPDSNVWGPMHWGHAVSRDLLAWRHLPIALTPDSLDYVYSGSAVVDRANAAGFAEADQPPPLIAVYTVHDVGAERAGRDDYESQAIAYSLDRSRTWTAYAGNPVLPNPDPPMRDFRDPNVHWDGAAQRWVMALAVHDRIGFYASHDLKSWTPLSDWGTGIGAHGGVWECPDLFALTDEATGESHDVLLVSVNNGGPNGGSATQYFVGEFSSGRFSLDDAFAKRLAREGAQWIDYGRDNFAGVTWSNIPADDGRRLFLGWMSNWGYADDVPTTTWRGAMTVPRTLHLASASEGPRLRAQPVAELQQLRSDSLQIPAGSIDDELPLVIAGELPLEAAELLLEIDLAASDADEIALVLANAWGEEFRLGYDRAADALFTDRRTAGPTDFSPYFATDRHTAPRVSESDTLALHVLLDRTSVELFADDGLTAITDIAFPTEPWTTATLTTEGGTARLLACTAYSIKAPKPAQQITK